MIPRRTALPLVFLPLLLLALARGEEAAETRLGSGAHEFRWVSGWAERPGDAPLGSTHGAIVVAANGDLFVNTDTERAVLRLAPDGSLKNAFGAELGSGVHGMALVERDGVEQLWLAHTAKHAVFGMTTEGEVLWSVEWPEASGIYASAEQFVPTAVAVAPDGRFWVADGYGQSWVHEYDAERNWVRAFGGPGSEPGKFQTPHGVLYDTRGEAPCLVVSDRENHRLQRFTLDGELIDVIEGFRRPCGASQRGDELVVADLAGRITIVNGANEIVLHLGDQPDPERRANHGVARELWRDGEFLAPHSAAWSAGGDVYVQDWLAEGRLTKLERVQ